MRPFWCWRSVQAMKTPLVTPANPYPLVPRLHRWLSVREDKGLEVESNPLRWPKPVCFLAGFGFIDRCEFQYYQTKRGWTNRGAFRNPVRRVGAGDLGEKCIDLRMPRHCQQRAGNAIPEVLKKGVSSVRL